MRAELMTHLPALRRYAYGLTGNRDAAEDLFQAAVARALEKQRNWRGVNLRAWLFAIMTNLHRNHIRSGRRTPESVPLETAPLVAIPPEGIDGVPDPLLQRRLVAALALLSPDMRAVLLLVVLEGYSYEEVARILDIPSGTVMSRLSRARRGLAAALEADNIVSMTQR